MLKKILCLALSASMLLGLYACGGGEVATTDDSNEQVTLKWIMGGTGAQKDSQEVYDAFNEKLKDYLPNTTVEFENISTTDFAEKWKLISASQEDVDIVWNGWMIPYVSEVQKGSYLELDELIDQYAPEIYDEIPENILDKSRVDGKLYSIPCMQQMVSFVTAVGFANDIYTKYSDQIDPQAMMDFFSSHKTMDQECWDKIEEYIKIVKDGGDLQNGVYGFANFVEKGYEWIQNPYKVNIYDDKAEPVNLYRTPEYETFVNTVADWFNKGYIRKDVLTADNLSNSNYEIKGLDNYLVGQGFMPAQSEVETKAAAGKTAYVSVPTDNFHYIPYAAAATNTAISVNSKNPARAMKLIALMNSEKGKDLYNLLVYGIEGKHYTKVNDNEITPIGYDTQPTADSPYGQYKWAVGNTYYAYEIYAPDKSEIQKTEFIKKINSDAEDSTLKGFTLNTDNIKTELAQVNTVIGEYKTTLNSGAAPNPQQLYAEFVEKLKLAGDDKIVEEISKQLNDWRANNGK